MKRIAVVVALLVSSVVLRPDAATAVPPQLALSQVLSGLSNPNLVTHAGDGSGRLFILELGGVVKVAQPGSGTATPFLNIASRISSGGERGLLGLAFHPNYESNGRFYVDYTRASDGDIVISEFQVSGDPNVADASSERILAVIEHSTNSNHNGGMIAFGPDGRLYAGVGDGGGANDPQNNAQNMSTPLGKIVRLDATAVSPTLEIYALGLRNPWRFSFDRADGRLLVGDVGQGAREEIDIVTQGGNYGWRVMEGTSCTGLGPGACNQPQFIAPILEYAHTGGRCSVTGGYSYRGSGGAMPNGTYIFGDYCTGEIFVNDGGAVGVAMDTAFNLASFGEDEAGELYVANIAGGTVHKLVPPGGPPPPPPPPVPCQPPTGLLSGVLYGLGGAFASLAVTLCGLGL